MDDASNTNSMETLSSVVYLHSVWTTVTQNKPPPCQPLFFLLSLSSSMPKNSWLKGIRHTHRWPKPKWDTFQSRYYRQKRPLEECFKPSRERSNGLSLKKIRENHKGYKPNRLAFQSRYYSKWWAKTWMTDDMMRYCFAPDVSILTSVKVTNP